MSEPATPLHLSWNTYSSVYSASFSNLRKKPKFEDVTLVVEDGHVLAHKIIISTCSPLLASIVDLSPNPGVIYLNNIAIKNLNLILDFMYTGEANVVNEDLNEFLLAASTLKVMGLTENTNATENTPEMEILSEDETKKEEVKASEDIAEEDVNQTPPTPKSKARAKRTTPAKTPAKTPQAKKRKSIDSASASKQKRKLPEEEILKDDSPSILGKIRNENESEECIIEVTPNLPDIADIADDEVSLNDSDFEAFGVDTDNTIDEITLDDDPSDDQDGKIILTRSKEDQVKLREIFDSFSKSKMKGTKTAWECTKCKRDFTNKRYVDSHIDFKHTDHVLHKCLECGMIRKSNDALARHMGKLHKKK